MLDLGFQIHGLPLSALSKELVPVIIGTYKFPCGCLVDISGSKNIISTSIPGRNGNIKECAGFNDYVITIHAVIQSLTFDMVYDELNRIIALWQMEDSLRILCPKTELYGIEQVIFESFSHPETKAMEATEILTLRFLSDSEFDVEVE
ncbi:MAG: DUF6046 domain-containing protein [Spirochaetota bacterium]